MKNIITLFFLTLPVSLISQIDADALMRVSSAKTLTVQSFEYHVISNESYVKGNFARREAAVLSKRGKAYTKEGKSRQQFYKKVKGSTFTSINDKTLEYEFAHGEHQWLLVDHSAKSSRSFSNDLSDIAILRITSEYVIGVDFDHFYRSDPMSIKQNYDYTFEEEKVYGGVQCYEISMPYGKGNTDKFYWYIAKEDSLPRGYKYAKRSVEVHLKRINFEPLETAFDIEPPVGYDFKELTEKNYGDNAIPINKKASTEGIQFLAGTTLPEWQATDLDGKTWSTSSITGKVTVIDFWGVWCAPCVMAMPKVQKLYDEFKDQGLVVIGMDVKDKEPRVRSFLKRHGYTYPIIHKAEEIAKEFKIPAYPTMFIVGKDGKVLHAEKGFRSNAYDEWAKIVSKALQE